MPANPEITATAPGNGATSLHDLFALTDEQILAIDPQPQDVEVAPRSVSSEAPNAVISSEAQRSEKSLFADPTESSHQSPVTSHSSSQATYHEPRTTDHDLPADPPQWLADRMADPQLGAEARELWNAMQSSRQEASAFREVFAKPEDARAAAQRARLLDDIDRAYFAGDATQRAELAASMLRENPAAFREMVFAGLRALEAAGSASPGSPPSDAVARPFRAEAFRHHAQGSEPVAAVFRPRASNDGSIQPSDRNNAPSEDASRAATGHGPRVTNHVPATDHDSAHLTAYAAFERAANADLERSVGAAIDRTLDQALPNANRADASDMKSRLATAIRQDLERALQGDRQLGEQVAQILAPRRLNDETRAQVVRLIGDRAHQLVPGAAKRILNEWTQTTLASHRVRTSRADVASTKREVEPARPSGEPARAPGAKASAAPASVASQRAAHNRLDYRRLSDEQILEL